MGGRPESLHTTSSGPRSAQEHTTRRRTLTGPLITFIPTLMDYSKATFSSILLPELLIMPTAHLSLSFATHFHLWQTRP